VCLCGSVSLSLCVYFLHNQESLLSNFDKSLFKTKKVMWWLRVLAGDITQPLGLPSYHVLARKYSYGVDYGLCVCMHMHAYMYIHMLS